MMRGGESRSRAMGGEKMSGEVSRGCNEFMGSYQKFQISIVHKLSVIQLENRGKNFEGDRKQISWKKRSDREWRLRSKGAIERSPFTKNRD